MPAWQTRGRFSVSMNKGDLEAEGTACVAADKLREDSHGDRRITAPLDAPTAAWVLEPLRLAAASSSAKLVDPALGCLHKLVGSRI